MKVKILELSFMVQKVFYVYNVNGVVVKCCVLLQDDASSNPTTIKFP